MKNKEKYAKEIVEIVCDGSCVAVDKATGNPVSCNNIGCIDCTLSNKCGCKIALKEWAESEYIEKPVISKIDKAFWSISEKGVNTLQEMKTVNCMCIVRSHLRKKIIGIFAADVVLG